MEVTQRLVVARWLQPAIAMVPAMLACAAFAASEGEFREHEVHEHGHGTLDIVLEGEELVVELRVPALNVVGFEHPPRDDAEREAVRRALVPFSDAGAVLELTAEAECEVEEAEAVISSMGREEHADHDAHDGEGHEHEEDAHHGDEHEEHASESVTEAHSELRAAYHFHCRAPARLARIEVRVFEHLLDAEEIDVRLVTPAAQLAMELHPGAAVVEFDP